MRAVLLSLALATARGAVTVDDVPVGPEGLRPKQECSDLHLWLRWLVHHRSVAPDVACGSVPTPQCVALARDQAPDCEDVGDAAFVRAALHAVRTRHRSELWDGMAAFTISAFNNWAVVEAFLESVLSMNPALGHVVWFVADRMESDHPEVHAILREFAALAARHHPRRVDMMSVADVQRAMDYDPRELAMRYELKTFNTAIKPHVFMRLFQMNVSAVLYFDPDIHFFSDLDEITLLLRTRSIVLTPHIVRETPSDGKWPSDLALLRAGAFNFGFVAVSRAHPSVTDHFLPWWAARLRYQGDVDLTRGLHFDQNWAMYIPAFYPQRTYAVLIDPRYNAAYWNLHYTAAHIEVRNLTARDVRYSGAPLVFFHFSGIATNSFDMQAVSPHQSRFKLTDIAHLKPLFEFYVALTGPERQARFRSVPYGYSYFDNGVPVPAYLRACMFEVHPEGRSEQLAMYHPEPAYAQPLRDVLSMDPFDVRQQNSLWGWLSSSSSEQMLIIESPGAEEHVPNAAVLFLRTTAGIARGACGSPAAEASWALSFFPLLVYADAELVRHQPFVDIVARRPCAALSSSGWHPARGECNTEQEEGAADMHASFGKECLPAVADLMRAEGNPLRPHIGPVCNSIFTNPGMRKHLNLKPVSQLWWRRDGADSTAPRGLADAQSLPAPPPGSLLAQLERQCGLAIESANESAPMPHRVWWRALRARVPPWDADARRPHIRPFGVNVIGHFGGVFGIGKEAEYLHAGLRQHMPTHALAMPRTREHVYAPYQLNHTAPYAINLVCINHNQVPVLASVYPWSEWRTQYNIGYWAWETELIPPEAHSAVLAFDEIWAISEYTAQAIRARLQHDPIGRNIPVLGDQLIGVPNLRPLEEVKALRAQSRATLELPRERCVFLLIFDCMSIPARKNPLGAVRAFQMAFARNDSSVQLIVKHLSCDAAFSNDLSDAIGGWPSIEALAGHYPIERLRALKLSADCLVSLHRSEGYGLNLLEAILDGTPVIASMYSGNLDFMKELPPALRDGLGVRCPSVPIGMQQGPYTADDAWCEPDLTDAAHKLAGFRDQRARLQRLSEAAAVEMRRKFSASAMGKAHTKRLRSVYDRLHWGDLAHFARSKALPPRSDLSCFWLHKRDKDIARALKPGTNPLLPIKAVTRRRPRDEKLGNLAKARAEKHSQAGIPDGSSCAFYSASAIKHAMAASAAHEVGEAEVDEVALPPQLSELLGRARDFVASVRTALSD